MIFIKHFSHSDLGKHRYIVLKVRTLIYKVTVVSISLVSISSFCPCIAAFPLVDHPPPAVLNGSWLSPYLVAEWGI